MRDPSNDDISAADAAEAAAAAAAAATTPAEQKSLEFVHFVETRGRVSVGVIYMLIATAMGLCLFCSAYKALSKADYHIVANAPGSTQPSAPWSKVDDNYVKVHALEIMRSAVRVSLLFGIFLVFLGVGKRALMTSVDWRGRERNMPALPQVGSPADTVTNENI